jgi:hypothetical protein
LFSVLSFLNPFRGTVASEYIGYPRVIRIGSYPPTAQSFGPRVAHFGSEARILLFATHVEDVLGLRTNIRSVKHLQHGTYGAKSVPDALALDCPTGRTGRTGPTGQGFAVRQARRFQQVIHKRRGTMEVWTTDDLFLVLRLSLYSASICGANNKKNGKHIGYVVRWPRSACRVPLNIEHPGPVCRQARSSIGYLCRI